MGEMLNFSQAMHTMEVEFKGTGNCHICFDTFEVGDNLLLPGCTFSRLHACHAQCLTVG